MSHLFGVLNRLSLPLRNMCITNKPLSVFLPHCKSVSVYTDEKDLLRPLFGLCAWLDRRSCWKTKVTLSFARLSFMHLLAWALSLSTCAPPPPPCLCTKRSQVTRDCFYHVFVGIISNTGKSPTNASLPDCLDHSQSESICVTTANYRPAWRCGLRAGLNAGSLVSQTSS